jgi:hypothetical protein
MKGKTTSCFVFGLALLVATGCGKSPEQKQAEEAAKQVQEASEEMAEAMQQGAEEMAEAMQQMGKALSGGKTVEPVNFRDLKALLPESLPGMERTSASGERTAAFGINVAQAEASYDGKDGRHIEINIVDMGSMKGLMGMAAYGWAMADFDRETDTGYERTTTYRGHRAFEEYNEVDKSGRIQVLVAGRFAVEIEGSGVTMEDLQAALKRIDLGKLEKMKMHGIKE